MSDPRTTGDRAELARDAFELWNRGDLEAFARERWHPDVVWEEPTEFPEAGVRHGRDACVRRMKERFDAVGHVEVEVVDVIEISESAAMVELIVRGRGQASGAAIEMRDWFVNEFDDADKAVRMREFLSREEAMRAADGLVKRPDR